MLPDPSATIPGSPRDAATVRAQLADTQDAPTRQALMNELAQLRVQAESEARKAQRAERDERATERKAAELAHMHAVSARRDGDGRTTFLREHFAVARRSPAMERLEPWWDAAQAFVPTWAHQVAVLDEPARTRALTACLVLFILGAQAEAAFQDEVTDGPTPHPGTFRTLLRQPVLVPTAAQPVRALRAFIKGQRPKAQGALYTVLRRAFFAGVTIERKVLQAPVRTGGQD